MTGRQRSEVAGEGGVKSTQKPFNRLKEDSGLQFLEVSNQSEGSLRPPIVIQGTEVVM